VFVFALVLGVAVDCAGSWQPVAALPLPQPNAECGVLVLLLLAYCLSPIAAFENLKLETPILSAVEGSFV
jgi:hypothetical protein